MFEYELNNEMALYGSIPLMLAHNWSKTVAVFWHNAAETWVDLTNAAANKVGRDRGCGGRRRSTRMSKANR